MNENMSFKAMVDGAVREYEVIFSFEYAGNGMNYVAYTDGSENPDGSTPVYAATYTTREDGVLDLAQLETAREWELIETVMNTIRDAVQQRTDAEAAVEEALDRLQERWDREDGLTD